MTADWRHEPRPPSCLYFTRPAPVYELSWWRMLTLISYWPSGSIIFGHQDASDEKIYKNWRGPRKPAPSDKFVAKFQVAENPLKFAMQNLFLWQNVPVFFVFFCHKPGNKDLNTFLKVPPAPGPYLAPSLPPPQQRTTHTHSVLALKDAKSYVVWRRTEREEEGGGGGGGGGWRNSIFFCLLEGHF